MQFRKLCLAAIFILFSGQIVWSQEAKAKADDSKIHAFAELTGGIGNNQGSVALAYIHNFKVGKKQKWELGLGLRFTSYFGSNQNFRTAPAKLTSGKTGPGVFFAEDVEENIDTLFFNKAQVNALNLSFNFGYQLTPKLNLGFNIDAIGFSFGAEKTATYLDGPNLNPPAGKPTGFNLLLVSDNDLGSLNSEFFASYALNPKWSVKAGYQFLFTEYKTNREVQTTPDGQKNDRFRNKVNALALGFIYNL